VKVLNDRECLKLYTLCDPTDLERAGRLQLVPWTEDCATFVGLRPQLLSGRSRSA
jgi:hypothetical protein